MSKDLLPVLLRRSIKLSNSIISINVDFYLSPLHFPEGQLLLKPTRLWLLLLSRFCPGDRGFGDACFTKQHRLRHRHRKLGVAVGRAVFSM